MIAAGTSIAMFSALGCATRTRRDPDQSLIQYQLAVEYYRGQRIEAALEQLGKALKSDPENAEAFNMRGIISLRQGHDYLYQMETVACLKGKDAEGVRGDATKKFREAHQDFQQAVALRPEFPEAWNNLSVAALQLQDWDAAITNARNALKDVAYTEPEVARANLGWAYFQKKDFQNSWKELHEAASRSPQFCVGRFRLAKVYMERGDMDLAVEEIEAVTSNKQCPIQEAFLLAGMVHERRKEREKANEQFAQCVQMAPRSCVADQCRHFTQMIQ